MTPYRLQFVQQLKETDKPALHEFCIDMLAKLEEDGFDDRLVFSNEVTFHVKDFEAAANWCLQLVKGGHGEGWKICAQVGQCNASKDLNLRARLLDFALTHAPFEYLEELLLARNAVELALLYNRVSDRIEPNISLDSDDGFEDARDDSDEESCDEWQDPRPETPPLPSYAPRRLLFNVTKNVLSATVASTSSLVSTMANKRMWKNAVGWLRPLRRLSKVSKVDLSEPEGNSDFTKQGCHGFYAELCPEAHISRLGPTYKSYALPSMCNPALDVSFTLFRIALIEESLCQGNSVQTNVTVIQEVIKGLLHEDLLLGISFLLLLTSPQDVHDVLSTFPKTEVSLQVCLYFYALQIYTTLYPWKKPGIAPVLLHDPNDVIRCIRSIIHRKDVSDDEDLATYIELFQKSDKMLSDYMQGQALQRLNAGVDIERFLADRKYKKDTLLGLAMSSDEEVIDLSVTLAKKYDISLWEVYMTHLQYLFDPSSIIDTADLECLVRKRNVLSHLKMNPSEFVTAMEKKVLLTIDGKDHDRLMLYFTFLVEGTADHREAKNVAETHLHLVTQIKDCAPSLDYKALLTPNANILEILKPVLTQENVDVLAKVAQVIPKTEELSLQPSTVYCAWAQKYFFQSSGKKTKTSSDWIKRFDGLKEVMKKMKAEDVTVVIKSFVLSNEATNAVPLEARREIIKKTTTYCTIKSEETLDTNEKKSWVDACLGLEKLDKHLDLLRSEVFQKLVNDPNPILREYAQEFMLSGGQPELLDQLSRKVLLDLSSLDVLRSVLAVFPEEVAQIPEDIFMDVLNGTLEDLTKTQQNEPSSADVKSGEVEDSEKNCLVLDHLLKELRTYSDEGGDLLDEEEVLDHIRRYAENETNPLPLRIRTLSSAQEFLYLNEEDTLLLQSMKTGGIVRDMFSPVRESQEERISASPETPPKVDTEDGRLELLQRLIHKMDSTKKAKSITELLSLWPSFQPQIYSCEETNPWLQVFYKLLINPKLKNEIKGILHLIYSSTKKCLEQKQITEEGILSLLAKLLLLPDDEGLNTALKIALRSSYSEAMKEVVSRYRLLPKAEDKHYDNELLKLVTESGSTTRLLSTILYGPLVTYLNEEENHEIRRQVVEEMESSGHWIEAASLGLYPSSLPTTLKTATNAVHFFRKWL